MDIYDPKHISNKRNTHIFISETHLRTSIRYHMNRSKRSGFEGIHMIFISLMTALPGKHSALIKKSKNPSVPKGIKIIKFLGMFGKPDNIVIFEAKDEETCVDFLKQFLEVAEVQTFLSFSMENMSWSY